MPAQKAGKGRPEVGKCFNREWPRINANRNFLAAKEHTDRKSSKGLEKSGAKFLPVLFEKGLIGAIAFREVNPAACEGKKLRLEGFVAVVLL